MEFRRYIIVAAVIVLCMQSVKADGDAAQDTTRSYRMEEVTVEGTRLAIENDRLPAAATVVSSIQIANANGAMLSDVMRTSPGSLMRSYGGPEGISLISLRGMSPEYTLILMDGQRLTGYQNGMMDLSSIVCDNIDRVEIVKGGNSALFGADAVAGIVNIITKAPDEAVHARFKGEFGSEEMRAAAVSLSGGILGVRSSLSTRFEQSNGTYPFYFSDGIAQTQLFRSGADYRQFDVNTRTDISLPGDGTFRFLIQYHDADRGSPGLVTSRSQAASARMVDRNLQGQFAYEQKTLENFKWLLHAAWQVNHEDYTDSLLLVNGRALDNYYDNRSLSFSPEIKFALLANCAADIGIELAQASITSNKVSQSSRTSRSAFASLQYVLPMSTEFLYEAVITPAFRFDSYYGEESGASPKIGVNLGLLREPSLRLRASYGRSFRMPTFNDLFWVGGGNPALKPEHSESVDGGLLCHFAALGEWRMDVSLFRTNTTDRILWLPGANGIYSPKNIRRVIAEGGEYQVQWSIADDAVTVLFGQQFLHSVEKNPDTGVESVLPYVPQSVSTLSCSVHWNWMTGNLFYRFSGFQYTTTPNDPASILSSYGVIDLNCLFKLKETEPSIGLKLEINNLFNEDYHLVAGYPMPLRTFRVGVECSY